MSRFGVLSGKYLRMTTTARMVMVKTRSVGRCRSILEGGVPYLGTNRSVFKVRIEERDASTPI